MNNFYKFPTTPYLVEPEGLDIRTDKVLSEDECEIFLSHRLIVEEKIDGANLGISFDCKGNLKLQNRGGWLNRPYTGQWKPIEQWIYPRLNCIFDSLLDRYILFGEWCYMKHSVFYDRLPDYFIGFDVFDKEKELFLSCERRNRFLRKMEIAVVPKIDEGIFSLDELRVLMKQSHYGTAPSEGIYLRWDEEFFLAQRAKLVCTTFKIGIDTHWSKKEVCKNRVIGTYTEK